MINITYSGLPILDLDKLDDYIRSRSGKKTDYKELIELLKEGNILGVMMGNSEVGPRALGNRSIIADPSIDGIKDKVNKIKEREWYRPFAPVVRLKDINKFFVSHRESPFMSFAVQVRGEYKDKLKEAMQVDGSARVQTVTKEQHKFFYDLLSEIKRPILNTSFNTKGMPLITTIEDAFNILDNTSLDYIYVEGYLFK